MPRTRLVLMGSITLALGVAGPAAAQVPTVPTLPTTTTSTTEPTTTTSTTTEPTTTTTDGSTTSSTTSSSTTTTEVEEEVGAQSGALAITVPSAVDAGAQSAIAGTSFSAVLGTVQVDDSRPGLLRTWTVSVSSTSFAGPGGTIDAGSISYWSGPATSATGTVVPVPGQLTSVAAETMDSTRTAFASTGGTGTTSVSWNPTIIVTVPTGVEEGDYSGTITHSVA